MVASIVVAGSEAEVGDEFDVAVAVVVAMVERAVYNSHSPRMDYLLCSSFEKS
jgi:hypothetical protein